MSLPDRFWERIEKRSDGCWIWTGSLNHAGYSKYDGGRKLRAIYKTRSAHRMLFIATKGHIPEGVTLDHLCRNRSCVNPDHLDPCLIGENARRSPVWSGNKTHCPAGHPYSGENLKTLPHGRKRCKTCIKEQSLELTQRRRQALLAKRAEDRASMGETK